MTETKDTERNCCKVLFGPGHAWRGSPCSRKAKVQRDSKWYCTIHDPVRTQARRDANYKKWSEQWDQQSKKRQLEAAAPALLKAAMLALDALKNADPGNPEHETGWASGESCEAYCALFDAIKQATGAP